MSKERTRRYTIEIKDAEGNTVWLSAGNWTDEEKRVVIGQNSRFCGMPDDNPFTQGPEDNPPEPRRH